MYQITFPTTKDLEKMNVVAKELFHTEDDNTQASPTMYNSLQIIGKEKHNFISINDNTGQPIAWSVVVPTSFEVMDKFLNKKITEKELLEISSIDNKFEALYLMAVVVQPDYRKKGIAKFLFGTQIKYFKNKYDINHFYSWYLSEEGKKLGLSIEKDMNIKISTVK